MLPIFGAFLLFTGVKLAVSRDEHEGKGMDENLFVKVARKFFPLTPHLHGNKFWVKEDGVRRFTPLFLVLLVVEGTDLIFAIDSIPAVLGILSLITWALLIVVTLKYVMIIMRADNHGEGGVFALTALVLGKIGTKTSLKWLPIIAGALGAALFFGHGFNIRFDYIKPFAQVIVADGQTLWLYDADLEQVTARKQAQALGSTPAALVATAVDLSSLHKEFSLEAQADVDGLQWVQATPKNRESTIQSVRMGLRTEGAQVSLGKLEIYDAMGQRSVLSFERFEVNPASLGVAQFNFAVPKGVSIIRP